MHRIKFAIVGVLLTVPVLLAMSGMFFDLSWNTYDDGGVTWATSSQYELGGSIAQHDAGVLSSGQYNLQGGFWQKSQRRPKVSFEIDIHPVSPVKKFPPP